MSKIDANLLDEIAQLEVQALLEGLRNPDLKSNPSFLEKVRKFLKENKLETTPETPGIQKVKQSMENIPVFEDEPEVIQ